MRDRGVRVVDGFDADDAAFQVELVRFVFHVASVLCVGDRCSGIKKE